MKVLYTNTFIGFTAILVIILIKCNKLKRMCKHIFLRSIYQNSSFSVLICGRHFSSALSNFMLIPSLSVSLSNRSQSQATSCTYGRNGKSLSGVPYRDAFCIIAWLFFRRDRMRQFFIVAVKVLVEEWQIADGSKLAGVRGFVGDGSSMKRMAYHSRRKVMGHHQHQQLNLERVLLIGPLMEGV